MAEPSLSDLLAGLDAVRGALRIVGAPAMDEALQRLDDRLRGFDQAGRWTEVGCVLCGRWHIEDHHGRPRILTPVAPEEGRGPRVVALGDYDSVLAAPILCLPCVAPLRGASDQTWLQRAADVLSGRETPWDEGGVAAFGGPRPDLAAALHAARAHSFPRPWVKAGFFRRPPPCSFCRRRRPALLGRSGALCMGCFDDARRMVAYFEPSNLRRVGGEPVDYVAYALFLVDASPLLRLAMSDDARKEVADYSRGRPTCDLCGWVPLTGRYVIPDGASRRWTVASGRAADQAPRRLCPTCLGLDLIALDALIKKAERRSYEFDSQLPVSRRFGLGIAVNAIRPRLVRPARCAVCGRAEDQGVKGRHVELCYGCFMAARAAEAGG